MKPKASFILPAYKRRFLREAIESILAQTEQNFELVVVDDASPENLQELVESFDDARLVYHRNETNIGGKDLVAAWNHAMPFARADWCILASDDDIYMPGFLEEMFRLQSLYPQCDLFHCRVAKVDAERKWLRLGYPRPEFESQVEMVYSQFMPTSVTAAPDFMFRRAALEKMGGFINFPFAWGADDATWMKLARNGCVCSPQVLFNFRLSGTNISSDTDCTAEGKLQAKAMFRTWFHDFVKDLQATDDVERFLLDKLVGIANQICDQDMLGIITNIASFRKWFHILRKAPLSRALKAKCVYYRLKRRLWRPKPFV